MARKVITICYKQLLTIFDILTIVLISLEIIAITTNVVLRYFFRNSLGWIDEFASFGLLWITFASALRLIEQNENFHVDAIVNRFKSKRLRQSLSVFRYVLVASFFAIVAYYSVKICFSLSASVALTLPVSKSWIYSILPISCFAILLILIRKIINTKG